MKSISLRYLAGLIIEYGKHEKAVNFIDTTDSKEYSGEIFTVSDAPMLMLGSWDGEKTTVFSQPINAEIHVDGIFTDVIKYLETNLTGSHIFIDDDCHDDTCGLACFYDDMKVAS